MALQRVVSVSGGKDSTAVYLKAIEHGKPFRAVFADTGHEHPATYEYVRTLGERAGGPQVEVVRADFTERLRSKRDALLEEWGKKNVPLKVIEEAREVLHPTGNTYVDACLFHGVFPSFKLRFCTYELKVEPIEEQVYKPILAEGGRLHVWLGLRRTESVARSHLTARQCIQAPFGTYWILRPILGWKLLDVFQIHAKHGIKANPLYDEGFTRVGCFPCIFTHKNEIALIAQNYPEVIDKLERWENLINTASRSKKATFFPMVKDPRWKPAKGVDPDKFGIRHMAEWASTVFRNEHLSLLPQISENQRHMLEACNETGVCE